MAESTMGAKYRNRRLLFSFPQFLPYIPGILLVILLLLPQTSVAYYVGPEVGNAPSETRLIKTRGIIPGARNVTSLAEAAYVPYVYSVGNNVVTFLRSIIPALQPKVDFFAEQIQDSIDTANTKLMQTLENSNNGIIAAENFFTGLMKAVVFGKGPEEDERRRRFAMALIRSGMLNVTTLGSTSPSTTTTSTTSTTTTTTTTAPTPTSTITTNKPIVKIPENNGISVTTESLARGATTAISSTTPHYSSLSEGIKGNKPFVVEIISSNDLNPKEKGKDRDNLFNKMRVINIVKNML